jgi:hypothetical protein
MLMRRAVLAVLVRITVDSASGVYESNAANNSAAGACTG